MASTWGRSGLAVRDDMAEGIMLRWKAPTLHTETHAHGFDGPQTPVLAKLCRQGGKLYTGMSNQTPLSRGCGPSDYTSAPTVAGEGGGAHFSLDTEAARSVIIAFHYLEYTTPLRQAVKEACDFFKVVDLAVRNGKYTRFYFFWRGFIQFSLCKYNKR